MNKNQKIVTWAIGGGIILAVVGAAAGGNSGSSDAASQPAPAVSSQVDYGQPDQAPTPDQYFVANVNADIPATNMVPDAQVIAVGRSVCKPLELGGFAFTMSAMEAGNTDGVFTRANLVTIVTDAVAAYCPSESYLVGE